MSSKWRLLRDLGLAIAFLVMSAWFFLALWLLGS